MQRCWVMEFMWPTSLSGRCSRMRHVLLTLMSWVFAVVRQWWVLLRNMNNTSPVDCLKCSVTDVLGVKMLGRESIPGTRDCWLKTRMMMILWRTVEDLWCPGLMSSLLLTVSLVSQYQEWCSGRQTSGIQWSHQNPTGCTVESLEITILKLNNSS